MFLIGNESAPIQFAQCRFPRLAMLNINIFLNKTRDSNFIKHHPETVMVWNCQNADCSLRKKTVSFIIIFGTLKSVRRILIRGSMSPCRLRRIKFGKFDYKIVHSEVYLNKYVVSIAPFSSPSPIQKTALFCTFSLFNFSPISPHLHRLNWGDPDGYQIRHLLFEIHYL